MAKKNKNVSQSMKNSKAAAAGMARSTAGRSRVFAGKKEKLAAMNTGDSEINEGLEEYDERDEANRQASLLDSVFKNLQEFHPDLKDQITRTEIAKKIQFPTSGNNQQDYENLRNQVERLIEKELEKTPSVKVTVEISVDTNKIANRFGVDTADKAVQHWIEHATDWPEFVQSITVKEKIVPFKRKKLFQ